MNYAAPPINHWAKWKENEEWKQQGERGMRSEINKGSDAGAAARPSESWDDQQLQDRVKLYFFVFPSSNKSCIPNTLKNITGRVIVAKCAATWM